jgi:hypothetical protein
MLRTNSSKESILKTIETSTCYVTIDSNNIATTNYKKDAIVSLEEIKTIEIALFELTQNKLFKNLLKTQSGYTSFETDARKYASNSPITKNIIASAFVLNTLPLKLMVNFYLQFNKPQYLIKVFSDCDVAYLWLLNYEN